MQCYTKAQLELFFAAVVRQEKEVRAAKLHDIALGSGATQSKEGLRMLNRKIQELNGN